MAKEKYHNFSKALAFKERLGDGQAISLGAGVSFNDSTVTEALCQGIDFIWLDMEHIPLTLEHVQNHVIAAHGCDVRALARVTWNDPVRIKTVLDTGVDGVIVPMIRSAEEAREAISACLYPPDGIRGFGPRRSSNYGLEGGPDFSRQANAAMVVIIQIEDHDSTQMVKEIIKVPGITGVFIGPNDLAASMGLTGQPGHPDVNNAVQKIIDACRQHGIPVGIGGGPKAENVIKRIKQGANFVMTGPDFLFLSTSAHQVVQKVRDHQAS
jgi:2-keto-3-deoxy-L-rhamnonate aldolase RhmA